MLDVVEARAKLLEQLIPVSIQTQTLPLAQAAGRLAAETLNALQPSPPFRRSVMDGYACRAQDLPGPLPVAFEAAAGSQPGTLSPGTCARIFTGAPVPEGADRVVPQENKLGDLDGVILEPSSQPWIRPVGDDLQVGQTLVQRGQRLGPAELGALASGGYDQVAVQMPLRVTLLTTGNEVQAPGSQLLPGQIFNSNGLSLASLIRGWGADCQHRHVPDDYDSTRQALANAAGDSDLVLTVGGVSVGDHDHVRPAIESLGQIDSFKVRMKPGKPFAFGQIQGVPVCCLPGNPASAMVTCCLFVRPAIQALTHQAVTETGYPLPVRFTVPAAERRRFLRVRWVGDGLTLHPNQDSGALSPMVWATGLAEIPPEQAIERGAIVQYHPFAELI